MIVIHHNPNCGTSRNVLAIIEASGEKPIIIDYLSEGWTRAQLLALFAAAELHPVLVNRPIVCSPKGVKLCRPSEAVLPLLNESLKGPFYKEDGELLIDETGKIPSGA